MEISNQRKPYKTWEIYKMIEEWNPKDESLIFKCIENNQVYKFAVAKGGKKGFKLVSDPKANLLTKLNFNLKWKMLLEDVNTLEIGDWIHCNCSGNVSKIIDIDKIRYEFVTDGLKYKANEFSSDRYDMFNKNNVYRKATNKEIENELKRRKWSKIDRKGF